MIQTETNSTASMYEVKICLPPFFFLSETFLQVFFGGHHSGLNEEQFAVEPFQQSWMSNWHQALELRAHQ